MSEKLNVTLRAEANSADGSPDGFGVDMTINYRNMGRATFATLESELMGMFKGLAETQIEVSPAKTPNGAIR